MITTARDMFIAFLHGIQKEDAEGVPAEKFNYWINKSQEDWLTERSKQFDTDQKRIDDLFLLRTERIINTNGPRIAQGNASLRILSDGTGTFVVEPERYFNISGLRFFKKDGDPGTIDSTTGEVTGATSGDVFYALIWFSELAQPIVTMITIGGTATGTHVAAYQSTTQSYSLLDTSAYSTFLVNTSLTVELMLSQYAVTWEGASSTVSTVPAISFTDYRFLVPNGYPNPKYFRLLNNLFQIYYVDNTIFADGESSWLRAQLMRADQRADIYQNAYRYPTDEKPYYRLLGEFIEFVNETSSYPLRMKLEYLRYPRAIKYVEPTSDDVAVDCELPSIQQKEIVDMAVRMYIEATQSPRYQSQIVEEQIKDKYE